MSCTLAIFFCNPVSIPGEYGVHVCVRWDLGMADKPWRTPIRDPGPGCQQFQASMPVSQLLQGNIREMRNISETCGWQEGAVWLFPLWHNQRIRVWWAQEPNPLETRHLRSTHLRMLSSDSTRPGVEPALPTSVLFPCKQRTLVQCVCC